MQRCQISSYGSQLKLLLWRVTFLRVSVPRHSEDFKSFLIQSHKRLLSFQSKLSSKRFNIVLSAPPWFITSLLVTYYAACVRQCVIRMCKLQIIKEKQNTSLMLKLIKLFSSAIAMTDITCTTYIDSRLPVLQNQLQIIKSQIGPNSLGFSC